MSTDVEDRGAQISEARHRLMANLRRLRQRFGWSQEELAARSGLHRTFVSSVERGERNISLDNIDRKSVRTTGRREDTVPVRSTVSVLSTSSD